MSEEWNLLDSGCNDAAINMALDEALLNWHSKGEIPPTIRFYGWSTPSLSLGHFQKVERSIHLQAIKKHQCQLVRRLTGGSAVLHDNELTYSVVVTENHPAIPKSVRDAYYVLSKGVLAGYQELGIQADYAVPDKTATKDRTAVCFEKTAYYELVVDGKKISGNAQTRKQGVLLQHGSIPLEINDHMLFDLFVFPNEEIRERKRKQFSKKASTINELTKKQYTYNEVKTAFIAGFKKGLDINLNPVVLSSQEWDEVYELAERKYQDINKKVVRS
ncbi:lipoate--protein ligase family protein [Virgibacillus halodenitrificans]|uniref:lipoate--protein ligase family protein n=1 Tax=Virgibacillus halodenitrificans TaxID=1482 RepID=UPI0003070E3D|nr:lipoate--protein ligase family protein [Virgibacillus halodenitrificans]MCJ0930291.1 lipoate--protein ligase family protein [Virgibacillus halodenitrificans]